MKGKAVRDAEPAARAGAAGRKTTVGTAEPNARRERLPQPEIPEIAKGEMEPQVRSAVMQLMDELDRLKEELTAANRRVAQLEGMADEDPLLPVLNRRGFDRELERTLAYSKRYGTTVALIYLDLDDFKGVNDRYGHAGGDAALRHFAEIMLANIRGSDVIGRLGGDEFAIILHRADQDAAEKKAAQLAEAVARSPVRFADLEFAITVTAGVTQLRRDDTLASVMARADAAMYEGKARRKQAKSARRTPAAARPA
ncbi:MAG: diguanylate cyclase [Methyloligellaceae bacterium]